jgi:Zn-dependent peptidase ImmA (M78 family)/DNA-binding XRE family transcriptional regulator
MTAGMPGFIGARLKEAREARGLTVAQLAELLGVTRNAVYLYETGKSSPQPEILQRLSGLLKVPAGYLFKEIERITHGIIYYRSMHSTTKKSRLRAEQWFHWINDVIVPYLNEYVSLPAPNLPDLLGKHDFHRLGSSDIESLASSLRRYWNLGDNPISNVSLLVENNGIALSMLELHTSKIDSLSTWSSSDIRPYIIINSEKATAVRVRFDIAHELGHLLMHRHIGGKTLNNPSEFNLIETQANRFAAAFLVPAKLFSLDLYDCNLNVLTALKPKWLVSIGMMIKRAQDLELISDTKATQLWINYSHRGWRAKEPLDDSIKLDKPCLFQKAFTMISDSKIQLPEQISSALCLDENDINTIANLKPTFFSNLPSLSLKREDAGILTQVEDIARTYQERHPE